MATYTLISQAPETGAGSDRACGSCTACCKTHAVFETGKPEGQWCPQCAIGRGCRIYEAKPPGCTAFRCEWLKGWGAEAERPDRSKIVLDFVLLPDGLPGGVLQIWELTEGALAGSFAGEQTLAALGNGVWPIHLPLRGGRKIFIPPSRKLTPAVLEAIRADNLGIADPREL